MFIADKPMNVNTKTYAIAAGAVSANVLMDDENYESLILYNESQYPCFVVTGESAPTAVFPVAVTPQTGFVLAPGATISLIKTPRHRYISAIWRSADSGKFLFVTPNGGR